MSQDLLVQARQSVGMTQAELAQRAGTSRTALSAYENGQKSPTLATTQRIVEASGNELVVRPHIGFSTYVLNRGHIVHVPNQLPQLTVSNALASVALPIHLNWSEPARIFDMSQRTQRARVYEIVLREGIPEDVLAYVDGALLADLWHELVLPRDVRSAWQPLLDGLV